MKKRMLSLILSVFTLSGVVMLSYAKEANENLERESLQGVTLNSAIKDSVMLPAINISSAWGYVAALCVIDAMHSGIKYVPAKGVKELGGLFAGFCTGAALAMMIEIKRSKIANRADENNRVLRKMKRGYIVLLNGVCTAAVCSILMGGYFGCSLLLQKMKHLNMKNLFLQKPCISMSVLGLASGVAWLPLMVLSEKLKNVRVLKL